MSAKAVVFTRALSRGACPAVAFVALAVLAGSLFDAPLLRSLAPDWTGMRPDTAIALLLAAGALWLLTEKCSQAKSRRLVRTQIAAGGVVLLGATVLALHAAGWHRGMAGLVSREGAGLTALVRRRMSPLAATDFVLLGTALLLFTGRPRPAAVWAAQLCALVAAFGAFVTVATYLYGPEALPLAPFFTGTALPAALTLLVLSVGVACARPEDGLMEICNAASAGGAMVRRLLPPVVVLPVALNWIELEIERRGVFPAVRVWMFDAALMVLLLGLLVWSVARALHEKDIARWAAEAELSRSEVSYRQLVEMSPVAILLKDQQQIEFANPAACALVGAAHEGELVGKSPFAFVHPESRAGFEDDFRRVFRDGTPLPRREQKFVRLDGGEIEIELSAAPVHYRGRRLAQVVARDITEHKRAERALIASEERFRLIAETITEVFWMADVKIERLVYISPAYEKVWGRSRQSLHENPRSFLEGIHPEDRTRVSETLELQSQGRPIDHEYRVVRPDGSLRWVWDRGYPVRGTGGMVHHYVGVAQDITERKRILQSLADSETRFRATFEQAAMGMALASLDGRFLRVNQRFCAITGYSAEELQDRPFQGITHPDDVELGTAQVRRLLEGAVPTCSQEKRYLRKDGSIIWVKRTGSLVRRADGSPDYIIVLVEDITQRRSLEEQLLQSQKMEAIGQLAGGVAHDFNNMLTAILGNAALMGMGRVLPASDRESLGEIMQAAKSAARLTRQLLLFSRREVMQPANLDLNNAVTGLAKMLQRLIGEMVRMELKLHPLPLPIHADAGMIDQMLINLAVNARDAMPGGGDLLIATSERTVDAATAGSAEIEPGRYACLEVIDNGTGIPPEVLPRIFEPFFTTKEAGKGTGLGLATVFGIVKQHRGRVTVSSEPGRGTTFCVLLPLADFPATTARTSAGDSGLPHGRGETVLLVEDDKALREMAARMLARHGYQVVAANHGKEALQRWDEISGRVDLLLTDMVMPEGVSGPELAAALQSCKPGLKVIFTSGYRGEIAGRPLKLESGQRFLQKPFEVARLLAMVAELLQTPAQ